MRDFFERQDTARRLSGQLAAILAGAVCGTVLATALVLAVLTTILAFIQVVATTSFKVDPDYWLEVFANRFYAATVVVGVIVIGVAVRKTLLALESGGVELARQLGAHRVLPITNDPQYQQLLNVVDELSIATGMPAPKVYVLEHEPGVNAFAAGIESRDTVVGVTRGALEHLNRGELQGVLAHEFSHIVNLDGRINVQTLGVLQGMEVVAAGARFLLGMGVGSGVFGSMMATVFGYVLWPVGQIGVLFGSLARMALNRQREFLADAAAVQYTRDPEALSSALKLIAGHAYQGQLVSSAAQSACHLFFAEGTSALRAALSSHPPLEERIRRLDPEWDGVFPIALPVAVAAVLDNQDQPPPGEVTSAIGTTPVAAATYEQPPASPPKPGTAIQSSVPCPGSRQDGGAADGIVSEADKQAFLKTLAAVRAGRSQPVYSPQVTHWPTLVATFAAVIVASAAFTWLTSR